MDRWISVGSPAAGSDRAAALPNASPALAATGTLPSLFPHHRGEESLESPVGCVS
ncbi:MAG: hypothetical protein QOG21_1530 [Actinomycetota bacterium]|jgi:hypothetical protein|nr:hypothetical protein [Actinomycetota bacterium]